MRPRCLKSGPWPRRGMDRLGLAGDLEVFRRLGLSFPTSEFGGGTFGSDADVPSHASAVPELHYARDFREQGVVAAASHVLAGFERCTTLAYDNRAARNQLSA